MLDSVRQGLFQVVFIAVFVGNVLGGSAFAAGERAPNDASASQELAAIDQALSSAQSKRATATTKRGQECWDRKVEQIRSLKAAAGSDLVKVKEARREASALAAEACSEESGGSIAGGTATETASPLQPSAPPPLPPSNGVPAAQLAQQSTGMLSKMRTDFSEVATVLQTAVDTGDVVKKNCVNEKVTTVKGMINIAEKADLKLQQAAVERRQADAELEFEKVSIASTRTTEAKAKAQECMGMMAFGTDENQTVEVNEPDDLPKGDQTKPPTLPNVQTSNPPASPSM